SSGEPARQSPERPRQILDTGLETPAGADSRPPGVRVGLSRGCALGQLELADDDPGGAPVVALMPPEAFPDPPAVLTLIVEQHTAAGTDVVFEFRHCSLPRDAA